jgi:hypothetical protein
VSAVARAAEYIAVEIAWQGSASDAWIASKLAAGGFDVDAAQLAAFGVEAGLLKPIPRMGGYVVTRRVNARVFGASFVRWLDELANA